MVNYLLDRVLQLFNDEIQVIPAIIREESRIKAKCYRRHFCIRVVEREILRVPYETRIKVIDQIPPAIQRNVRIVPFAI